MLLLFARSSCECGAGRTTFSWRATRAPDLFNRSAKPASGQTGCRPSSQRGVNMATKTEDLSKLLPSAQQMMEKLALAEAEKADAAVRRQAEAEAEKKLLIDKITKPSGVSDEEAMKRVAVIVNRAVSNGLTEVQVYRFPNKLCTDNGRAINQQEPGWEKTLTGLPKEMYEFWDRRLRPLGYKLRFQIVDWPDGMPGDVGISLKWA